MSHSESETAGESDQRDDTSENVDHEGSWSANLEHERHAESLELLLDDARAAVRATEPGYHVNLVTHGTHGHPEEYLWEALEAMDRDLAVEYVEQCGCGGHVTRVHVQ